MSEQVQHQDDDWGECASGELRQLARQLHTRQRRENLAKAAQVGAWSMLLVAVGVFLGGLTLRGGLPTAGGIACPDCVAQFEIYHAHLTSQAEMEPLLVTQMQAHLEHCQPCRDKFVDRYPDMLQHHATVAADNSLIAASADKSKPLMVASFGPSF